MVRSITAFVATLALGLFLVPGLATAAHHEKDEGHDKSNPCMEKAEGEKMNPCKGEAENPCMEKKEEKGSD